MTSLTRLSFTKPHHNSAWKETHKWGGHNRFFGTAKDLKESLFQRFNHFQGNTRALRRIASYFMSTLISVPATVVPHSGCYFTKASINICPPESMMSTNVPTRMMKPSSGMEPIYVLYLRATSGLATTMGSSVMPTKA